MQLSASHHKLCKLHWLPARRRREVTSDAAVELKRTAADCELRHRRVTTTKQSYAGAAPLSKCLRTGPNIDAVECAKKPIGPRDVIVRCYDISSDGKLAPALSLATSKRVHWFPKLTCSVGDRAWASVHESKLSRRVSATAEVIGYTRLTV